MTFLRRCSLAPLLACLLASAVAAAEDDRIIFPGKSVPAAQPEGGGIGNLSLVAGLVLAAVGGWLVWRGRRGGARLGGGQALAIAETKSLGNRQFLVVATYEDKKFLLGVCPDRIALLAPLHDEKKGP
jgi:flagellar protein FliO/FliZ